MRLENALVAAVKLPIVSFSEGFAINIASHVTGQALEVLYFHCADSPPIVSRIRLTPPRGIHSFRGSWLVI